MQQAPDCTYLWLWYGSFTVLSNNKNKINIEAVWWVSDYSLTLAGFARGTYLPSLPFVCKRYLPTFFTFCLQEVPTYLLYLKSATVFAAFVWAVKTSRNVLLWLYQSDSQLSFDKNYWIFLVRGQFCDLGFPQRSIKECDQIHKLISANLVTRRGATSQGASRMKS